MWVHESQSDGNDFRNRIAKSRGDMGVTKNRVRTAVQVHKGFYKTNKILHSQFTSPVFSPNSIGIPSHSMDSEIVSAASQPREIVQNRLPQFE